MRDSSINQAMLEAHVNQIDAEILTAILSRCAETIKETKYLEAKKKETISLTLYI